MYPLNTNIRQQQKKAQDETSDITKTCLYNFDLLKPHFYIVNRGGSNEYP